MTQKALARKSLSNIVWSYAAFVGAKLLNFVSIVILARLLGPEDFGLMAFCVAAIAYFEIVSRFGLGSALISRREDLDQTKDAVFFFGLATSLAMAAGLWLGAERIAAFMGEPRLTEYLRVLCFALAIDGLAIVPFSMLQRDMRFKAKLAPDLSRSFAKGLVGVGLALSGHGVWSLVIAHVSASVVSLAMTYVVNPWRPRALPDPRICREILRYGSHLLAGELINALQRTLDTLLVGRLLGAATLGLYTVAYRIPDLAIRSFNQIAGGVIHPVMSQIQTDPKGLKAYYLGCLRHVALVTFPAGAALSAAADPLVRMLYPPEWYGMIFAMQCLSISLALLTIDFLPGTVYKAINRPEFLTYTSALKVPVFGLTLYLAAREGMNAVALAQIGLSIFYFLPNAMILNRVIGVTAGEALRALTPGLLAAGAVGAAGMAVSQAHFPLPILALAAIALVVSPVYACSLRVVSPETFREARRLLTRKLPGRRGA